MNPNSPLPTPVTEAELHAFVDRQLTIEREREVGAWLADRPGEAERVRSYRTQKDALHALFDPVLHEPLPQRVLQAARRRTPWYLQRLAAGVAMAMVGGALGWSVRAGLEVAPGTGPSAAARQGAEGVVLTSAAGFAQRAAVAHAVYAPEQRRPVEVDAAHEEQLVAWLSKRMGAPMKPPHLQAVGYTLEGGRLLPGGQGPVAQFMYRDEAGSRLTLYVSNDVGDLGPAGSENTDTAFRFARQGQVNVFYWVEGKFGYALSADTDRATLSRVSSEVYRQLGRASR